MKTLAGGGMNVGQVIGSTDKTASTVTSRPIHYRDGLSTLYRNLGIDSSVSTITDLSGRPRYLLDDSRTHSRTRRLIMGFPLPSRNGDRKSKERFEKCRDALGLL